MHAPQTLAPTRPPTLADPSSSHIHTARNAVDPLFFIRNAMHGSMRSGMLTRLEPSWTSTFELWSTLLFDYLQALNPLYIPTVSGFSTALLFQIGPRVNSEIST